MAAFTFPATTPIAPEQSSWARNQLRTALENNKTRFKELSANAESLAEAEAAVLLVASRKQEAYERAKSGAFDDSFGWVKKDPDLAAASSVLSRLQVDGNDIDTIPTQIAQLPVVEESQAVLF